MTTEGTVSFDREDLAEQARANQTGLVMATIAYVKRQGLPLDEYMRFLGERFAKTWDDSRGQGALGVSRSRGSTCIRDQNDSI